jgi:phage terminase large subunit-like protein
MPRINRRVRALHQPKRSRAQLLELLLGPNGAKSAFKSPAHAAETWALVRRELTDEFAEQWHIAQAERGELKPFSESAEQYARDVVDGSVLACKEVKLACRRHLRDLADSFSGFAFDRAKADRVCRLAELLPHVKGKWASNAELIRLQPWQIFILCSIFGWVKKSTATRRFSLAYIEVGRKNAKSILAAIIGIYMFACDEEFGAEVYSGATKEDQAMEVFRPALQMLHRSPELASVLGVEITGDSSKKMRVGENGSRFEVVVRDPGDGASPHCGIVDEYHEHDADTLYDTFRTGMGAREQPLQLVITTSGFNLAGPCALLRADLSQVLNGFVQREEMFGVIYTIDEGDDWTSENALIKANPNFDVSVFRDYLLTEQRAAIATARKQGVFKTKHLCVWVGANAQFFNVAKWRELADPDMKPDQFIGSACVVALDLSTKRDFSARIVMFKKIVSGKEHYYLFPRFYLPQEQAERPEAQHYQGWVRQGFIRTHSGAVVDFARVQEETNEEIRRFKAREFAFDPWNAAQFAQCVAIETKAAIVEIQQTVKNLNAPMRELDALIAEERIHHDGNPVLTWMIGNVTAHEDANENVFPRKEGDENKIDGAVGSIMALSRLMVAPAKRSIYATRGLLTLDSAPAMGARA